ncbi:hypothetical protein B5C34_14515 [Pacificimonas flava]|uniref:DUF2924 domain-containing protein n=2 Tax=Pacificimonas TaxID=1960290 RepID=A0A219B0X6_9SPHN|nr:MULTISPECIES: DUF2924 domain-containing protein [Pacificimonas]MBZ6380099.1 DUF2924 domain-containing protein [Pacificimonas aurantium]OWV31981.1 hypothetical protein B5C34_14515 [Pacificimonas flava]
MSTTSELVKGLDDLDLDGLRAVWRERYGDPPPLRSEPLFRLMLGFHLQAESGGGVSREVRRTLRKTGATVPAGQELGLGAVLRREWKGRVVEVVVEADGFRLEGRLYRSLSAAATAAAGSRWNGPRFFGLRT